jgi:pimeloyl-ACP methyl ester carboxylesterase
VRCGVCAGAARRVRRCLTARCACRRCTAVGLLGHSRWPLHARTFDLEEQTQHLLCAVDAVASADAPVTIVGHSIGAHLALRALAARPERVTAVVGLYPFLTNNTSSLIQRACAAAVRLRPLVWLVAAAAELLAALPAALRRGLLRPLLRHAVGLGDDAVSVTCDWLRAGSVQNTCVLGASEFAALAAAPDWATLNAHAARVALLYGPDADFWAPPAHAAEVRARAPGVTVVADAAHGHMFCTTPEGAQHVAGATARLLRGIEAASRTATAADAAAVAS